METIYISWLKRTEHISDECDLCKNQRYYFDFSLYKTKPTIYACPSCNWNDLQIVKDTAYLPLHKFVMVKNGTLNINSL
jgi:hypothetical protein